jgi:hypothetical protein
VIAVANMRALLSAILICVCAPAALAQSYSASGQVGYLSEWEMKASLARTVTGSGEDYSGPVTLRHVGLCSVNGVEEKSGTVRLTISPRNAGVEGTLAMKDDSCRIVASASRGFSGLLSCRDGQGIPIHFSIDRTGAEQGGAQAAK